MNIIKVIYVVWSVIAPDGTLYRQAIPRPDLDTIQECERDPGSQPDLPVGVKSAYAGHKCVEVEMSRIGDA